DLGDGNEHGGDIAVAPVRSRRRGGRGDPRRGVARGAAPEAPKDGRDVAAPNGCAPDRADGEPLVGGRTNLARRTATREPLPTLSFSPVAAATRLPVRPEGASEALAGFEAPSEVAGMRRGGSASGRAGQRGCAPTGPVGSSPTHGGDGRRHG